MQVDGRTDGRTNDDRPHVLSDMMIFWGLALSSCMANARIHFDRICFGNDNTKNVCWKLISVHFCVNALPRCVEWIRLQKKKENQKNHTVNCMSFMISILILYAMLGDCIFWNKTTTKSNNKMERRIFEIVRVSFTFAKYLCDKWSSKQSGQKALSQFSKLIECEIT